MITDTRRWELTGAIALAGWTALLAGGALIPGAAPALLIVAPPGDVLRRLPDAVLVSAGRFTITLARVSAAEVYAAGGLLVLPAGLRGCLALTPDRAGAPRSGQ